MAILKSSKDGQKFNPMLEMLTEVETVFHFWDIDLVLIVDFLNYVTHEYRFTENFDVEYFHCGSS